MKENTRLEKSLKNAKVSLAFFSIMLFINFFSRKIFIGHLGDEFVGTVSVLFNILGVINLAELGIGSVVSYMLYKPIFDNDQLKIREIISIFGYLYSRIALIIIGISILFAPFLPLFFRDSSLPLGVIYFGFYAFLGTSLLGYFFNYKQTLLWADQKQYVVTTWTQLTAILKFSLQIVVTIYTQNLYWWIAIELITAVLYSIIISRKVNKTYPYLTTSTKWGKKLLPEYGDMTKYIKQVFVHRIGGVVLVNTSTIFIYMFTTASMVTHITNYSMLLTKLQQLVSQALGSIDAGVGSVVAEGKKEMIHRIYFEISSLYFYIAGVSVVSLWFCVDPFVSLWLGSEYIIDNSIVALLLINLFLVLSRVATDSFISAYGLFYDIWAPITEAALNVTISIIGGWLWGIKGVLLGTTISVFLIVHVWKPYFLFAKGMRVSVWSYWRNVLRYILYIVSIFILFSVFIEPLINIDASKSYLNLIVYAIIVCGAYGLTLWFVMWLLTKGMRDATRRIINKIVKRNV